jgi:hypothetical protein
MAVANFKTKVFDTAIDLANYVKDPTKDVSSVVSVVTDNNGKYVLFYIST